MFELMNLNEKQQEAVLTKEGPVLVIAGAGSGKTRALTQRVYNLINEGVAERNILAITFTNKATSEMRERLKPEGSFVTISTFHSLCVRILREFISEIEGFNKYFTIYNEDDKNKLIRSIIKSLNYEPDEIYKEALYHISTAKNNGLTPDEYLNENNHLTTGDEIFNIYSQYEKQLNSNNALDFDDLLLKTHYLLSTNSQVLNILQNRYLYIHVDEFQDTNVIQYKILKLLAGAHKNIFVVGDEDQCIYSWRGASIQNTQDFIKDFKPKIIKLEQNYRSTKNIIEISNKLIKNNANRIEKKLWTNNDIGENVKYYKAYSDIEEAEYVSRSIYNLIHSQGYSANEIAVLYRMNALSRLIEEKLMNYNIPFILFGGFKFFERAEIKNILSYMWLLYNTNDNENLKKIINFPKRGIGATSVEKLDELSSMHQKPIYDIIMNIEAFGLSRAVVSKIQNFRLILINIMNLKNSELSLSDMVSNIISLAQIKDAYSEKSEENYNRLLNIGQLIDSVKSFEELNENSELVDYLQSVSLQGAEDVSSSDSEASSVVLSTIHACKGLEFKAVFIIGSEEGLFPISKAFSENDIEEERRLMYVAVTRAIELLTITSSSNRMLYNQRNSMRPSKFLLEMELVKPQESDFYASNTSHGYASSYNNVSVKNLISQTDSNNNNSNMYNYTGNAVNKNNNIQQIIAAKLEKQTKNYSAFKVGITVLHPKFGVGVVIKSNIESGNNSVEVNFSGIGVKMLNLDFAPLQIIEKKN